MRIKWYAHACLRIEGGGVSIITDPYTPHKSGFAPVDETADIVVRSSDDDSAHSNAAMIPGDPEIVTATHILSVGGESATSDKGEARAGRRLVSCDKGRHSVQGSSRAGVDAGKVAAA